MCAAPDASEKKTITFENGQSAEVLYIRQTTTAASILEALNIPQSEAAIIIGGSTDTFGSQLKNRLLDLLSRGVAQATLDPKVILIDQGIRSGVSELVGQGVADRGRKTTLVGVLPQTKTVNSDPPANLDDRDLDTNHTHFVINEQDQPGWQAQTMCDLAAAASQNKDWIITILIGGELEGTAMDLALETVRRGWTLVVVDGSGPLTNTLIGLKKVKLAIDKRTASIWTRFNLFLSPNRLTRLQQTNPRLYEIISDGKIMVVEDDFDAIQLRNLIKGIFTKPPEKNILWLAWQRFAEYDQNSSQHRNRWHRMKVIPILLSVASTLLVLVYSTGDIDAATLVGAENQNTFWANWYIAGMSRLSDIRNDPIWDALFRLAILLIPIVTSVILGTETRRKHSSKYILLRGGAETVKRGIYSYRVLKNLEGNEEQRLLLPYSEAGLASHLNNISKILLDSDVKESAFTPYDGQIPPNMFGAELYDDGFKDLDPETYVRVRIGDQLRFYTQRTNQYERRIRQLQNWALIFGGIGTFLAAIGAQYWLPLTAAIVSAATAFLEYPQLEQILTKYNLTKASLESIQANWLALSPEERKKPERIRTLVRDVEATLEGENQGWVQYVNQVQKGSATQK